MAEKKLSFETGIVTYHINDSVDVAFNPTDSNFVERLYDTFTELDSRQDEFQARVKEIGSDKVQMFEYARERDKEMRGMIDNLLGSGVSEALFAGMNVYSLAGGLPVWVNLMFAIADEIHDAYDSEQAKTEPKLKTYDAKYQKLMKKYQR